MIEILYPQMHLEITTLKISYNRYRYCVILLSSTLMDSSSESGYCYSECIQQYQLGNIL